MRSQQGGQAGPGAVAETAERGGGGHQRRREQQRAQAGAGDLERGGGQQRARQRRRQEEETEADRLWKAYQAAFTPKPSPPPAPSPPPFPDNVRGFLSCVQKESGNWNS